MSLIYIHGFNSSSLSAKAQETKRWLEAQGRGQEWICPDLPHRPAQAMQVLEDLIRALPEKPKIIGSSLGGFYATLLVAQFNMKAVVINPAVHPALILRLALGRQKSWHNGEYYEFTPTHLDELNALDTVKPLYPDNILLMQETGDEVLAWQDAVAYYRDCHQLIFRGGDHGFTRFRAVLDLIDKF